MNHDTFCVAPWFQIRNENIGNLRPCCDIHPRFSDFTGKRDFFTHDTSVSEFMDSDWMNYLRESLFNGERPRECQRCWHKEANNIKSERQILNEKFKVDIGWVKSFFKKNDIRSWKIISTDWKYSNLCNLGCVMCKPADSTVLYSHWLNNQDKSFIKDVAKDKNYWIEIKKIFKENTHYDMLDDILRLPSLKFLKILGGEPLFHDGLIQKLSDLDHDRKKNISLHFITNGTKNLLQVGGALVGFKDITFSISLDGIGAVNEWIRAGSQWQEIERNIISAKTKYLVYVHCTIQAINLPWLWQIWNWCHTNSIPLDFGIVNEPKHLSVSIIDTDQRKKLLDKAKSLILKSKIDNCENFMIDFDDISAMLISMPYLPGLSDKFWEHVNMHDQINGTSVDEILQIKI
jgi:hypothetical protein